MRGGVSLKTEDESIVVSAAGYARSEVESRYDLEVSDGSKKGERTGTRVIFAGYGRF